MSSESSRSPLLPVLTLGDRKGRFAESRMELAPAPAEIVGNTAARLNRTSARAARSRASAIFRFWLAVAISTSSPSRSGSPKIVHHWPRGRWSLGVAVFQPSAYLYAGVMGTEGFVYSGPTM